MFDMKIADFLPIVMDKKPSKSGTFVVDSVFDLRAQPKRGSKIVDRGIEPQKIK
jgi:hypothetical protein